jgi:hypothetical protein
MDNFTYFRCQWDHDLEGAPTDIWSEIGADRFETRKLEYFSDGTVGYASEKEST